MYNTDISICLILVFVSKLAGKAADWHKYMIAFSISHVYKYKLNKIHFKLCVPSKDYAVLNVLIHDISLR